MATTLVPPVGPLDAKIAIIGEAPGAEEVKALEPFVGESGMKLNEILSSCGILRSKCYITNVIKERPTNNNVKLFIDLNKKNVTSTVAYRNYEQRLKEELSRTSANVIVACGAISLWALCRLKKITKRRGSILESTLLPGRKVIPILHPAYAMRPGNYISFRYINLDMLRVVEESEFPEIKNLDNCHYNLVTDYDQAVMEITKSTHCLEHGITSRLSFDIECDINSKELTAFAISMIYNDDNSVSEHAFSIGLIDSAGNTMSTKQELHIIELLTKALSFGSVTSPCYVMQNGIFDATFMFRKYGIQIPAWLDTMIGMGIAHPDYPKGLDFITSIYTKMPYYKDEGKESQLRHIDDSYNEKLNISINSIPTQQLTRWQRFLLYNAKDARATNISIDPIMEDVEELGNGEIMKQYIKVCSPLIYMSERGVKLDVDKLSRIKHTAEVEAAKLTDQFLKISNEASKKALNSNIVPEVSPTSNKQLISYFYVTLGHKPYISRTTRNPTVDAEAMIRLTRKGVPGASEILKLRKLNKLKSTYYNVNRPNGRLHGSYNPIGTKQGRLSSSATIFGEGTNMQNQPRAMKELMVADEGMLLFDCDLSQAENRIVAYCGQERKMIEAFENGVDVHASTAHLIWPDLTVDEIIYLNKMYENTGDKKYCAPIANYSHTYRFYGKKSDHELNYGMGYKSFALICEIPESDSKKIVNSYFRNYPGVKRYQRLVVDQLRHDRTVTNLFGRKIKYMEQWRDKLFKRAYSYIPQSVVAHIINEYGLNMLYYNNYFNKYIDLLMQTHDSIVFQLPISMGLEGMANLLSSFKSRIEVPLQWEDSTFIIPLEIKCGFSLGKMKGLTFGKGTPVEDQINQVIRSMQDLTEKEASQ